MPTREPRQGQRRRIGARAARATRQPQQVTAAPSHTRERDAGGPEDRARYHCACGYVFEASVSTTVGCPHCGGAQAW